MFLHYVVLHVLICFLFRFAGKSIRSLRISDKDSIDLEPVDVVKAGHFNEEFEMRKKCMYLY